MTADDFTPMTHAELTEAVKDLRAGDKLRVWLRGGEGFGPPPFEGKSYMSNGDLLVGSTVIRWEGSGAFGGLARIELIERAGLTVEELDALPMWSVVEDCEGDLWIKNRAGWGPSLAYAWSRESPTTPELLYAPFTLVHDSSKPVAP